MVSLCEAGNLFCVYAKDMRTSASECASTDIAASPG